MSKKTKKEETALPRGNDPNEELSEEDRNLFGFFELLLEVDMRINPQLYKTKKE